MANITEMMRAETNKADRALNNLEERNKINTVTMMLSWPLTKDDRCFIDYPQWTTLNSPDVNSWYLRPLENTTNRAADQQAELLCKEHPGNLTKCRVCLTLQVQNCRSKESNAESKAEENTPVSQRVMGIPFEQSHNPLIHKHLSRSDRFTSVLPRIFLLSDITVSICDDSSGWCVDACCSIMSFLISF